MSNGDSRGDMEEMPSLQQCKLFVGGLYTGEDADDDKGTTNESMRAYFEKYGEVLDSVVMIDGQSRKSRGFGFLTFADVSQADACLDGQPHIVDGKQVEVKKAVPKPASKSVIYSSEKTCKVFLGGLPLDATKEDIAEAVSGIGQPVEVSIMTEKHTNKPRGFGFVRFNTVDEAEKTCGQKYFEIRGRQVEAKKAQSQEATRAVVVGSSGNGGGGGGGGGRGGQRMSDYPPSEYPRDPYRYYKMGYVDYPSYMRGGDYGGGYGGGYDRAAAFYANYRYGQNYDMSAYMYGHGRGMGTYSQSASGYGPTRGYTDRDRQGGGDGRGSSYHPYRR